MDFKRENHGSATVVKLAGLFEVPGTDAAFRDLTYELLESGRRQLAISCAGVRFLSSTGLGILTATKVSFERAGGRIVLCDLNDRARNVMRVTHLDEVFELAEDVSTALAAFAARSGAAKG